MQTSSTKSVDKKKKKSSNLKWTTPNLIKKQRIDPNQILVNIPGIDPLSPLYLLGTQLITISANYEVFVGLPNDDVRLAWLQLHRDQAVGIAPYLFLHLTTTRGHPHLPITTWDNVDVE